MPLPGAAVLPRGGQPFFFGREAVSDLLGGAIARRNLVAVVGASGSGKSSVVRAGLLPRLRGSRQVVWEMATFVPGDRPFYGLAAAVTPLLEPDLTSEADRLTEVRKLAEALQGGVKLRDVVGRVLDKPRGTERLLLVADQWEELYTLTPDEASRRRFVDEILDATGAAPLSVVLTLRGDFVGQAFAYRPLSDALQDAQVNLGPMTRQELERAIREPAGKVGLRFEPGLVERILDDVGEEPGNLPLLEFVLKRLWDERRPDGEMRHEAYGAMGCLEGAIATKAEEIYNKLSALEQDAARRVFLQLVRPELGADDTRRRARLVDIGQGAMAVTKRLADERLLVTATAVEGETLGVSHEALIRHWERLKAWVNGDREFLLWRERFRGLLATWQEKKKDPAALLPPALLAEAERWLTERGQREVGAQLSPEEIEYIEASAAKRRQEVEAERLRAEQELASAKALAEAQATLAREAEARRVAEADRATAAEREVAAQTDRAQALQRARRWTLVSVAVLSVLVVALGIAPARREWARWWLRREIGRDMIAIKGPEGGKFLMGCVGQKDPDCAVDEKRHEAPLARDFGLMGNLVTVAQFRRYSDGQGTPMTRQPKQHGEDGPVVNVAWEEARRFCDFVGARLPTEAEWEYAARGGHGDWIYPWGDGEPSMEAIEKPHGFELRDMSGVVYQWTESISKEDPIDGPYDPASDEARVIRGGSLGIDYPQYLRASYRYFNSPVGRNFYLGFRCAWDGSP